MSTKARANVKPAKTSSVVESLKRTSEAGIAACPATVLALIAEVERLRAELAGAKSASKVAETRMDASSPASARLAAPAAGTEKDTARLDFMITEECQIEHMDRPGADPLYRVRWPWGDISQRDWSATPREAIDTAIAAKEPPCSS